MGGQPRRSNSRVDFSAGGGYRTRGRSWRGLEAASEEHPMRWAIFCFALLVVTVPYNIGGCTIEFQLPEGVTDATGDSSGNGAAFDDIARLEGAVGTVQTENPYDAELPASLVAEGDTVVIDAGVDVIVDVEEDLTVVDLPDSTVIGFDNQTGLDLFLRYLADGELQGVYVYDGETLLLDYPCLSEIVLLSEDDIDPPTGIVVDSFELGEVYVNPDDFLCGDAVIFPFEADSLEIVVEYIDLED
jgi:hypothetical protein